jgi:hypothetical protein
MSPVADNPVIVPDRELEDEKTYDPSDPRIRCRSAVGRPAKKTDGLVTADTSGTRSIPEASAQPACISGLRLSAYRVAAGQLRTSARQRSGISGPYT